MRPKTMTITTLARLPLKGATGVVPKPKLRRVVHHALSTNTIPILWHYGQAGELLHVVFYVAMYQGPKMSNRLATTLANVEKRSKIYQVYWRTTENGFRSMYGRIITGGHS